MGDGFREAIGSGEVGPTSRGASAGWVIMGYLASTSDTSAIADYNVLLGQGDVIRPHRIESNEERNLFDIYRHLWYYIYPRISAALCARPISAMARELEEGFHA